MIWKPTIRFGIPTGDTTTEIDVVSLAPHGQGYGVSTLAYLQYVKSGMLRVVSPTGRAEDSPITHTYLANVSDYARRLAAEVEEALGDGIPDVVIETPSSRDLNQPYTRALLESFPQALDLSSHLRRLGKVKSGEGASVREVLTDIVASDVPWLEGVGTLIVVDDVLEAGKAVEAVIARLQECGLPATAGIILAVPLVAYRSSTAG
jgi:hypothetical protein